MLSDSRSPGPERSSLVNQAKTISMPRSAHAPVLQRGRLGLFI